MSKHSPQKTAHPPEVADAAAIKRAKAEKIGRLAAMFIMPLLMVGMMVTGYLVAMHSPTPHNMPIVVAGQAAQSGAFAQTLQMADPDAVDVSFVQTAEEARQLVMDREASGAVYINNGKAILYTASAAGASQVSTVSAMVVPQILAAGMSVESENLQALPASDSMGLGAMFMATALVMAGYLPFSVMLSNSPELLRFRRAVPLLAGWSALVAGLIWLVTGPVLNVVESGHAPALLGIAWLGCFAISCVQLFFTRIFGPMAVLVGMLLLMVLGIPSSNMAMSVYTMPPFYSFLHSFLPTPAIGEAMRSALYFGGAGIAPHIWVLAIGAALGLLLTLLVDAIKRKKNPVPAPVLIAMPALHGGKRPKTKFMRYLTLLFFPLAMVTMMISLMLGAMFQPTPRDMPVAVVGASIEQAEATISGLEENMSGLFEFRALETSYEARNQVADREVVGALVLPSAENPEATIFTNTSGGSAAAMTVKQVFTQVMGAQQLPVTSEDVAPLPTSDSGGTVSMYLAIGWIMSGFMIVVVGANAAPSTRPLKIMIPIVACYALFMSAIIWLIAAPITGAISGHFWQLFGVGAIAIFCVAWFTTVFERLIGLLAIIPVVGIMMFLGVPASNGALSIYMEPAFFAWLHGFLPMPAAVESIRSILYFGGDVVGQHLMTFGLWGAISLVLVFIIDKIKPVRTETPVLMYHAVPPVELEETEAETHKELVGI